MKFKNVEDLGWEGSLLEEGMATDSNILTWIIPMNRGAWQAAVHGVAKSRTHSLTKHSTHSQF